MPKQTFGCKENEGYPEITVYLPAQYMVEIGRSGAVDDLHVVVDTHGKETFHPGAGMFRVDQSGGDGFWLPGAGDRRGRDAGAASPDCPGAGRAGWGGGRVAREGRSVPRGRVGSADARAG